MDSNEAIINHFYTCFQNKDFKGMQVCYADNASFSDPVFTNLNAQQVKAMWQMLIIRGKDLVLTYGNIKADKSTVTAQWTATYTFSATGKKVINKIKACFVLADGKIVQHRDNFSFYNWAKQALGATGFLLGWTSFLKHKVQSTASKSLTGFMNAQSAAI